ncbi:flippase, partial [Candidatus Bathyarchaeota archaeon]|nr:flippase [Candidatus Bathyarchaeota archaeon]
MGTELIRVAKGSVRGGFFLVSGTVMATIVMAIGTIVTARLLGPEFYGQYTLAFVFPQIIFIIADLGISQGIIKFTASLRSKGETQRVAGIVRTGLIIRASVGALLFLVTYALSGPIASVLLQRPELTFYLQVASISILFEAIFTTSISFFVGIDRSEFNALTTNIHATIKTIVSIALVLLGFGVIGAVVGYVSGFAVAAAVGLVILLVLLRDYKADSYDFTGDLKTLMRYGGPLYLSLMLIGIIPLYSNLILAFFETDVAIGNYKAAANFIQLLAAISIPITTSLLPAFSKLDSSAKDDIKTFFQHTVKYSTLIVLPLAVMMMLLADDVIQTIYGNDFQSAGIFLAAYCLIYFLVGFGSLTLPSFFNGLGKTRETLKMGLFTFIPMAVLSPLLAVAYGVLGLILGIVLGYAIGTFYG